MGPSNGCCCWCIERGAPCEAGRGATSVSSSSSREREIGFHLRRRHDLVPERRAVRQRPQLHALLGAALLLRRQRERTREQHQLQVGVVGVGSGRLEVDGTRAVAFNHPHLQLLGEEGVAPGRPVRLDRRRVEKVQQRGRAVGAAAPCGPLVDEERIEQALAQQPPLELRRLGWLEVVEGGWCRHPPTCSISARPAGMPASSVTKGSRLDSEGSRELSCTRGKQEIVNEEREGSQDQ